MYHKLEPKKYILYISIGKDKNTNDIMFITNIMNTDELDYGKLKYKLKHINTNYYTFSSMFHYKLYTLYSDNDKSELLSKLYTIYQNNNLQKLTLKDYTWYYADIGNIISALVSIYLTFKILGIGENIIVKDINNLLSLIVKNNTNKSLLFNNFITYISTNNDKLVENLSA